MKKPLKPSQLQPAATPEDFINQGAPPAASALGEEKSVKAFSLRMEPELLKELQAIKDAQPRHLRSSIHQFIMQAIVEKVARVKQMQDGAK